MRFLPSSVAVLALAVVGSSAGAQVVHSHRVQLVEPRAGMVIDHTVRFKPGTYRIAAPAAMDSAAMIVRGNDITVYMNGVSIEGLPPGASPDSAVGVLLRIDGGSHVRVIGGHVRGYKVGLLAKGTHDLTLTDNDFSYNWKPRLYSLIEHESLVDWLSYHHNEKDEWLRYGAAFYLEDVHRGEIRGNTVTQGMNALMLVRSDSLLIWSNDFSFNSGLGIGMYRSSDNRIMHNRLDFNVRGYSDRFYKRGQDSADLLVFEQSSRNVFAYNSVTHGGDGFFLWAGQQTMDTGEGGANDNLLYANDFSFAPTNGIEATFSRNTFAANTVEGSDHAVWGGYSYDTRILGNHFAHNRVGIAIEHGQNNGITGNRFDGDTTAIFLWGDPVQPSDWGYPKHHDTESHRYRIAGNIFDGTRVAMRIRNTNEVTLSDNTFAGVDTVLVAKDTAKWTERGTQHLRRGAGMAVITPTWLMDSLMAIAPKRMGGGLAPDMQLSRRPRSAIVVDEWGPFDWKSPKVWPIDSLASPTIRLAVLGPAGRWTLKSKRGLASISKTSGRVTDTITVTPSAPDDWSVTLSYVGAATTSPQGAHTTAGAPLTFGYTRWQPHTDWHVRAVAWSDSTDPRTKTAAFDSLLAHGPAVLDATWSRLDLEWYGPQIKALPLEKWGLSATGDVELPAGSTYALRAISDDGMRVWVDGALVIDDWASHESDVKEVPVAAGKHRVRVEFYQSDGWTEMRLEFVRR